VFVGVIGLAAQAVAFEAKDLNAYTPPAEALRFGLDSYRSGDKQAAAEALNFAAERGNAGAQWKLGRMYAEGDGVERDDRKAFAPWYRFRSSNFTFKILPSPFRIV
jgi:TPR repeat protein